MQILISSFPVFAQRLFNALSSLSRFMLRGKQPAIGAKHGSCLIVISSIEGGREILGKFADHSFDVQPRAGAAGQGPVHRATSGEGLKSHFLSPAKSRGVAS